MTPAGHVQVPAPAGVNVVADVPTGVPPALLLPALEPPPPPTDPDAVRPRPPGKLTLLPLPVPPRPPVAEFCAADWPPCAVTAVVPVPPPNVVSPPLTGDAPLVPAMPHWYGMTCPGTTVSASSRAYSPPPPPPPDPAEACDAPAPPPPVA